MAQTLYEKIGGDAAVNAAVDIFYRKVLADDRISNFFEGVDMEKQAAKQKAFLTMAFGGPHNYTGKDMRDGHAHLVANGLNDTHFDAVMENLGATLQELNVPDELIQEAAAIAETPGHPGGNESVSARAVLQDGVELSQQSRFTLGADDALHRRVVMASRALVEVPDDVQQRVVDPKVLLGQPDLLGRRLERPIEASLELRVIALVPDDLADILDVLDGAGPALGHHPRAGHGTL
jgi:hemoglobin